ncbi:MAG: acetyl-CoA acetyltransferase [Patescibacteria group bacterium]|nr:MAG: acetyl-CoA acetyltransferase [Patescibacteria group bacterium]
MKVYIKDYYQTRFGELWERSLTDLIFEVATRLLDNNGLSVKDISAVFLGNMLSGVLDKNLLLSAKINEVLGNIGLPVVRSEAACASGSVALYNAVNFLKSEQGRYVLVLGVEKMTDFSVDEVTTALSVALSGSEQMSGLTFPGVYALMARLYLDKYNYTEEDLAKVAVINHFWGSLNPKAQFRNRITIADVLNSAYVADPLKVYDCSPISDGCAGVLLTTEQSQVEIASCCVATDSLAITERKDLLKLQSVVRSGQQALEKAGIDLDDIDLLEVHDCFTIAELLVLESLGVCSQGTAVEFVSKFNQDNPFELKPVVNTSGGLKSSGHPVGATGVKQIGEIFLQLTNQAGERQIDNAKVGLAQNTAGSGGLSVVTILKK